jgi:hypothetical protein
METVVAIKIVPLRIDPLGNTNERFNTGAERGNITGISFAELIRTDLPRNC